VSLNVTARRRALVGNGALVALVVALVVVIYKMLNGSYGHQPSPAESVQMHQDWRDLQRDARQVCKLRTKAVNADAQPAQNEQNAERSYADAARNYTYTWQWYKQPSDIRVVAPSLEDMIKLAC